MGKIITCDCSHCGKKGLLLNFVDKDKSRLLKGKDKLVKYFFNKKIIRHLFCRMCDIESFAEGATFPKAAVNVHCLDGVDILTLALTPFTGKDL